MSQYPKNLQEEIWKPIVGYEGLYEVSNKGRIKSLRYFGGRRSVIMKLNLHHKYTTIMLCKDGNHKTFLVHRLVYEAFFGPLPKFEFLGIGNGDKMMVINHKDENPHNNNLENLELITHIENINYGTAKKRMSEKQINNKKHSNIVYQYTLDYKLVKIWPSTEECGRNGYNEGHVAAACRNNNNRPGNNKYKKFLWSYTPLKIESK